MGTNIHAFVEYADDSRKRCFSRRAEEPAWCVARFSLSRDYALFDALGDGRNNQMEPKDVGQRALIPPRGIPVDLSLEAAWEYYDVIVESQQPHPGFWPNHGFVRSCEADERVQKCRSHLGNVVQNIQYGMNAPTTWHVVSKDYWHTPSWLLLPEIQQSMEHHHLSLEQRGWDFRAMMKCLTEMGALIGSEQVRLVFWFDN